MLKNRKSTDYFPDGWDWVASPLLMRDPDPLLRGPTRALVYRIQVRRKLERNRLFPSSTKILGSSGFAEYPLHPSNPSRRPAGKGNVKLCPPSKASPPMVEDSNCPP